MAQIKVFVYETLKSKLVQKEALGHVVDDWVTATISDMQEVYVSFNNEKWPSLVPAPGTHVYGELFKVDEADLASLDNWEENYKRILLPTDKGMAWVYVFNNNLIRS